MTERMNRLPHQVRSIIACHMGERNGRGVIAVAAVMDKVRASCPDTITDRELEDAIAEEAIAAGLAVHFNHT